MKYPFEKVFFVCTGARCNDPSRGEECGEAIRGELKDHNKAMGRKPTVRVCAVSCLDFCDYGPNMVVHPSGEIYSGLNRARARTVYDAEMGDAQLDDRILDAVGSLDASADDR